jgi:hypothetical protein
VTRAVLRLHAKPRSTSTALIATTGYETAVRVLRRLQAELGEVSGFEAASDPRKGGDNASGFICETAMGAPSSVTSPMVMR